MIERGLKLLEFLAKCPVFYLVTELLPRMWRKKTTNKNNNKGSDMNKNLKLAAKLVKTACNIKTACNNMESEVKDAEWEITKLLPNILKPLSELMKKCALVESARPAIAIEEMRLTLSLAIEIQKAATEVVDSFLKKEFTNTEGADITEVLITEPGGLDLAEDDLIELDDDNKG